MGIPILDGCCCCCKLNTGVTVLGVLSLLSAIWNIINLATGMEAEQLRNALQYRQLEPSTIDNIVIVYTAISAIFNIIYACTTVLLIQGVRKDNPKYMKPYLIWGFICMGIKVIFFISLAIVSSEDLAVVQMLLGSMILTVIIQLYFLWVVYSYIKTVEQQADPGMHKMRDNY